MFSFEENLKIRTMKQNFLKNILFFFTLLLVNVSFSNQVFSQTRTVKGTVVNAETKETLPGVSVSVKGTTRGTATNSKGQYEIDVSPNARLVFSSIGMKSLEVSTGNKSILDVVMQQENALLDEVVVVGYGTQKKINLTGAVSNIKSDKLENRSVGNLSSALQGTLPGLVVTKSNGAPGKTAKLNIRGYTSINGGSPLILIDGVQGDLNDVNPTDVESVSVLKDASSAAVYGARAAFGVVLITTKSAKDGKLTINYSANTGWATTTTRTDYMTNPYDVLVLIDSAFLVRAGRIYSGYSPKDYDEIKKRTENPSLPNYVIENRKGKDRYIYYGNTDWWNEMFFKYQPTTEHNLSISGGNDKINFRLSGRAYKRDGLLKVQGGEKRDNYSAYNIRNKLDISLNKYISLTYNVALSYNKNIKYGGGKDGYNGNPFGYRAWIHALPSYLPQNPDGTATATMGLNNYIFSNGVFADLLYGKSIGIDKNLNIMNMFGVEFSPIKTLHFHADYTFQYDMLDRMKRSVEFPYSQYPNIIETKGHNWLSEQEIKSDYQGINAYGTYDDNFEKHNIKVTLGFNQEHKIYKSVYAKKSELLSDDLNSLDLGTIIPETNGYSTEWSVRGIFGRVSYNYDLKYLVEFNGRYDGSSRFPKTYRWGFFPSGSVGWVVSNENFMKSISFIDYLKFRSSYGSLGNQQVANYAYIPTLSKKTENYLYQGNKIESVDAPAPNPKEITWEKVNAINLGMDISLFGGFMDASVDIYERQTLGMLTKGKTLPATFGTLSPKENSADLSTKGYEISVNFKKSFLLNSKPLRLRFSASLSDQITKVTKFDNPTNYLGDYYEGMTIGEIWGYHIPGLFQTDEEAATEQATIDYTTVAKNNIFKSPGEFGKLLSGDMKFADLNNDKKIGYGDMTLNNHGDLKKIGNSTPRYQYSFGFSADWNGIDFSTFFQGVGKQYWYPLKSEQFFAIYHRPYVSFIRKDLANNIWSPQNPNGYYPRLRGYEAYGSGRTLGEVNDRYLQDVSYLRLKNLTIGYTFPKKLTQKINIEKIRIYFSGENLFTFTNLTKYLDPEAAYQGDVNYMSRKSAETYGRGQAYPHSKTFTVGINVQL